MQRLTARFLLLFAIVGTLLPLASAVTAPSLHACCIRKAAHQCHGSNPDQRSISGTGCCSHDCCRAARTSGSAHPQPSPEPVVALTAEACVVESPVSVPAADRFRSQSSRAPPQIILA